MVGIVFERIAQLQMLIEGLSSRQWKRRERQKQRRRKRKRDRQSGSERENRERKEEKKSTRAVLRHQQADKTVVAAERVRLDQR